MDGDFAGKSLRRVERWLGRCLEACRLSRWSAALAEIECARAELEVARQEIWTQATAGERPKRRVRAGFVPVLKGVAAALLFLVSAAVPLAVEDGMPRALVAEEEPSFVFVTQDEKAILARLRESLSGNAVRNVEKEPRAESTARRNGGEVKRQADAMMAPPPQASRPTRDPAVEAGDVMVLVQVGERALRESTLPIVND